MRDDWRSRVAAMTTGAVLPDGRDNIRPLFKVQPPASLPIPWEDMRWFVYESSWSGERRITSRKLSNGELRDGERLIAEVIGVSLKTAKARHL